MVELAELLKDLREAHGASQAEVSKALGSGTMVTPWRWEQRRTVPKADVLEVYARMFKVEIYVTEDGWGWR